MQTITEHLEELRKLIIQYIVVLAILSFAAFYFIGDILKIFTGIIDEKLVFISIQDGFIVNFKLSILCAFIFSIPILLIQIWRFVSGALKKKEKNLLYLLPLSLILFVCGVLIAYFVILPFGIKFLINYGKQFYNPMISAREYMSFVAIIFFVFGMVFQLPLVLTFLNRIGLMGKDEFRRKRIYFYAAAFIVGAILTPPDVITQILLAIPIIILFEISYIIIILLN